MSILIKTIAGLVIFIAISCLFLQFDDDLNPNITKVLSEYELSYSTDSEAYYYINGILAGNNDHVIKVGKDKFKLYQKEQEVAIEESRNMRQLDYSQYDELTLPDDGSLFCNSNNNDCIKQIKQLPHKWGAIINEYEWLTNRFEKYLTLSDFKTISQANIYERYLYYKPLVVANQVMSLKALHQSRNGEPKESIDILLEHIQLLKKQLVVADTLVHKLIFTSMISHQLDVINDIALEYGQYLDSEIALLTKEEISFIKPLNREIVIVTKLNQSMDEKENYITGREFKTLLPLWVIKMMYKPNITSNYDFNRINEIIEYSNMPMSDIYEFQKIYKFINKKKVKNLRNISGSKLLSINDDYFNKYLNDILSLNSKIVLVNHFSSSGQYDLYDLYFPDKKIPTTVDISKRCLPRPIVSEVVIPCVNVDFK